MTTMKQRRDLAATWAAVNPVPAAGQICVETDTRLMKVGDGETAWNALGYSTPPLASEAEALAGTDNTKAMTPLRARQALATYDMRLAGLDPANSAADNLTAFTTAFAALSSDLQNPTTVVIPPGDYTLAATIDWRGKSVRIEAEGARIASSATTIMQVGGTLTSAATTMSGNHSLGDRTLDVADGSGFAAGDVIRLRSSGEVFNDDRPTTHYKGEIAYVVSVASNTLTLLTGLNDSYDATTYTVSVDLIAAATPVVNGLTIVGTGTGQHGLLVENFIDAKVSGVTVVDAEVRGLVALVGMGFSGSDLASSGSDDTTTGYGLQISDVDGASVTGFHGRNNRHSVDVTGTAPSRNVTVASSTAKGDSSAGFSSHGSTDRVTFRDCWADWCGGGFVIRGSSSRIEGGGVRGTHNRTGTYMHGIFVGDDTPNDKGNGRGGKGLRVIGVDVDLRGHGIADNVRGMYVTAAVDDARIVDSTFRGHAQHGLYFSGDTHRELHIRGCLIDSSSVTVASSHGILLVPTTNTTGNNSKGVHVVDNRFVGDGTGTNTITAVRIHGNVDNAAPSDRIFVHGNDIEGFNRGVGFEDGYYDRARVYDNTLTSISNPFVVTAANWVQYPAILNNHVGNNRYSVVGYGTAAPASGTYVRGDVVLNSTPSAAGAPGWVCVTAGTPGTWKAMANLAA